MKKIHNKYKHFHWYPAFVIALIDNIYRPYFTPTSTIVNSFAWNNAIQGPHYWQEIHLSLIKTNYTLSKPEADILSREALDFYGPLYEEYRSIYPELFI